MESKQVEAPPENALEGADPTKSGGADVSRGLAFQRWRRGQQVQWPPDRWPAYAERPGREPPQPECLSKAKDPRTNSNDPSEAEETQEERRCGRGGRLTDRAQAARAQVIMGEHLPTPSRINVGGRSDGQPKARDCFTRWLGGNQNNAAVSMVNLSPIESCAWIVHGH